MARSAIVVFCLMLLWPALAPAETFRQGGLVVVDPWARASTGAGSVVGVFLTLKNDGDHPDRLIGASSENANEVQLHQTVAQGAVMKMIPIPAVDLPAHGDVALKPGGYHLMLMGLKAPLRVGDTLPLSLTFEHGGTLAVRAEVLAPGSPGPRTGTGGMPGHPGMAGMSGMGHAHEE